jgi:YfiH family protein
LLTSRRLSVPHGFSTRAGGVSVGPFASLNAGAGVGDDPLAVAENLARLVRAAGGPIATAKQVHGAEVVRTSGPGIEAMADALWTDEPGGSVGVRTADCVPILIEDPGGRRVAAVHAGWRGVAARVVERAVAALVKEGARASELKVALGPCIQRCCFEVSGDLPERFAAAFGPEVVVASAPGSRHLDLPLALVRSLAEAGVLASQIDVLGHCTSCDPRFFSHRRDRGVTGRHLSFITCPARAAGL